MTHPGRVTRRWFFGATVATIIAGDVWFQQRKNRHLERARQYRTQAAVLTGATEREAAVRRDYLELAKKHERAASRPWLSVRPAPPSLSERQSP